MTNSMSEAVNLTETDLSRTDPCNQEYKNKPLEGIVNKSANESAETLH